jgi:class 3 adenylate cyclase/tetratricopeptide (TPR) repeat protein
MTTCPNCGRENPEGFQFCGYCRAELIPSPSAARQVRKTVTVVFTDVTGSTSLGERLDPESMRRVMGRYFESMKAVLERHGGTVEKFIGDAVMAVFGIPAVHEDDALRAVRAAVEMGEALEELNKELERDQGVRIETRTGVNSGEVVAGDPSGGQTLVTGDAVNVSARLQQAAQPGEILIGAATYRLVRDAVTVGETRAIQAKGKSEAVQAVPLIEVLPGMEGFRRRVDSPMVGRERELRLVREAFDRASSEQGCHLFTILGSAGVGKSRLVDETLRAVGEQAWTLRGRCLPYGEGITFWPVLAVIREAAGIGDGDLPDAVRSKIGAVLEGEETGDLIGDRIAQIAGLDEAGAASEEIFWAVRKLLEALARRRPLVIVFDDIQWGETTFLDLIEHLADWSRDAPMLLLCIARPDLVDRRPTWGGGKMNATSILLEPLTDDDSVVLIENLLGRTQLEPAVRTRVMEAAEGNPLFVEQMVSMLIDDGLLRRDDGHWVPVGDLTKLAVPPTIQALLAARLDRLEDEERAVIERAAVVGKTFYRGAVAELGPTELRSQVGAHLMTLVRKELIRPDRSDFAGEEAFRFRHILIRDAAYDAMPKETRADLHEGFAAWLDRTTEARSKEYDEIVGYHLEQAHRLRMELGPADERARRLANEAAKRLSAAGRRAGSRGDPAGAAKLLSRALALEPSEAEGRASLLHDLGAALVDLGEFGRGDALLAESIEVATQAGDRRIEWLARVERATVGQAIAPHDWGPQRTRAEATEAIEVFEALHDDLGLARAFRALSETSNLEGNSAGRIANAERGLEHARRAGDRREETLAVWNLIGGMFFGPTPAEEGIRRCTELLRLMEGNRPVEAQLRRSIGRSQALQGRFDEAREGVAAARAMFEDLGLRFDAATTDGFAGGIVESLAGDYAAAEAKFRAGYEVLQAAGERAALSTLAAQLAQVVYAQGRYVEAQRIAEASQEMGGAEDLATQIGWRGVMAKLLARQGLAKEAERLGREGIELAERTDFGWRGDQFMDMAEVLRLLNRPAEALPFLERAIELYEQKGNAPNAERARALLAELRANV